MTMTLADAALDDGAVSPRADRPKRRTFTAEYKAQIVAEYEAADHGERGAILVNGHSKVPGFGQVEVPTLCGVDH